MMPWVGPQKAFIYGLVDPRTNVTRYVGRSSHPKRRLWKHMQAAREVRDFRIQSAKDAWLNELAAAGLKPGLVILEAVAPGDIPADREVHWIRALRENDLFNYEHPPAPPAEPVEKRQPARSYSWYGRK